MRLSTLAALLSLFLTGCDGDSAPAVAPDVAEVSSQGTEAASLTPVSLLSSGSGERLSERSSPPVHAEDAAPAIHGRVVDVRTGNGVEGFRVRLDANGTGKLEVRSDAQGRFAFPLEGEVSHATLWTAPPRGWRWTVIDSYYAARLTEAQRTGAEEFVFEVAETRTGTVRGIAVDDESGEPIPHLAFSVRSGGLKKTTTKVLTDERGRFAILEPIRGGRVDIVAADGELRPRPRQVDLLLPADPDTAEPWRVAFQLSPTFRVRLEGAVAADPLSLRLFVLREDEAKPLATSPLRVDERGPWARPPRPNAEPGEALWLALGDEAGHVLGMRAHNWSETSPAEPLAFALEPTGAVQVDVPREAPSGASEGWDWGLAYHRSLLAVPPHAPGPAADWRAARMRWLAPGPYELRLSTREHAELVCAVEVLPGRTTEVTDRLALADGARTVIGRVRSEDGEALSDLSLTLSLRDEPSRSWSVYYTTETLFCGTGIDHFLDVPEDDPSTGAFRIERVPPGELDVRVGSAFAALHATVTEQAGGDLLVEVLQLGRTGPGMGFRVAYAESGQRATLRDGPLGYFGAQVHTRALDGGPPLPSLVDDGRILTRATPAERDLEWAVAARGHRPVFGTEQDFQPAGGGRYYADVLLEQGWGARVLVTDASGAPLEGARVLVDGEPAGWTDARGELDVAAEAPPTSLAAEYRDWAPPGSFPAVQVSRSGSAWHTVMLAPPGAR